MLPKNFNSPSFINVSRGALFLGKNEIQALLILTSSIQLHYNKKFEINDASQMERKFTIKAGT